MTSVMIVKTQNLMTQISMVFGMTKLGTRLLSGPSVGLEKTAGTSRDHNLTMRGQELMTMTGTMMTTWVKKSSMKMNGTSTRDGLLEPTSSKTQIDLLLSIFRSDLST